MSEQIAEQLRAAPQSGLPTDSFDIRTMPEAFFQKQAPRAPMPWGILAVVGIVILTIVGVGLYFLLTGMNTSAPAAPPIATNEPVAQPEPETPSSHTGGTVVVPDTEKPTVTPSSDTPKTDVFPKVFSRTTDTDNDNLTDEEEKSLFTDPNRADTDGDGYADGQELVNLYDPLAPSPALLEKSQSVAPLENKKFGFHLLYPSSWPVPRPTDESETQTMIATPIAEEFFTINVLDNPNQQSALEWYLGQAPANTDPRRLSRVFLENLEGVWSIDGRTAFFTYLFGGERRWIYGITYTAGEKEELNYLTIFQMLIQSFRVIGVSETLIDTGRGGAP